MTDDLPAEVTAFAALLDAQPEPVRSAFHYCLALMMVEAGRARLVETRPGEAGRSEAGGVLDEERYLGREG